MAYTALPDMRIPYDNDGTVLGQSGGSVWGTQQLQGVATWWSGANMIELNDEDHTAISTYGQITANVNYNAGCTVWWLFFPETREVTAHVLVINFTNRPSSSYHVEAGLEGSSNTTNGVDGTWETASLPGGGAVAAMTLDDFRADIKAISFTGGKKVIRFGIGTNLNGTYPTAFHFYGEKYTGQTPDDIIFINHDDTPGVEFTAPEDFGDQPLATTVVRQFRLKNTSATKTANTINIQCNDPDFAISTDGSTWVVTINIASLSAGAESSTLYVRCTTPAVGALLGPRFSRIVVTVASYT